MPRRVLLTALVVVSALFVVPANGQTEPADRIAGPIDASQRVVTNGVHPLATRQNDEGRVSGAQVFQRMVLLLEGSKAQEQELQQLLAAQQDPSSPEYHHWLTPAEFGRRFGPSQHDLAAVTGWLKAQGFTVEPAPNGRRYLVFTGMSAQVENAFQTEMHRYAVNGKTYVANAQPASVPKALAGVVRSVASLTSFHPMLPQSWPAETKQFQIQQGVAATGPADLAAIYDAAPLNQAGVEGQGESVALIEESNIDLTDLSDFRTVTGLPAANVNVIVNGPDPGLLWYDGEEFEAISDVEYAGAMAPKATLNVVVSESTEFTQGILLSLFYAVDNVVSPVTSLSYGGCETLNDSYYPGVPQAYSAAYEQGAAEGISHFVSSGDYGGDACLGLGYSAGYGVNAIGDSPWNVSVGGTEFIMPDPDAYFPPPNYTATGYIPESTWNDYENPEDGRPLAGNGGVSINFTKPAWQTGPGVPADGQRDVPDVSLLAGDNLYYLTCEKDLGYDCADGYGGGVIGTSLAAPNWAAIQTLVNQKNGVVGGVGNPNPAYYRLAAGANSPFHDITAGDTKVPDFNGDMVGYIATPGFDLATGLGSVDVNALAAAWQPPTGSGTAAVSLSTNVQQIVHGAALTATISVTASGGKTPTGDVVLMADGQGAAQVTLSSGAASFQFGPTTGVTLPGGSYNLTTHYAGDANFAPADSSATALVVDAEATATTATTAPGPIPFGEALTVSAAAIGATSGQTVPGTYTFTAGGKTLGTAPIAATGDRFASANAGVTANLTLSGAQSLPAGMYSIVAASPAAGASFLASTSTPVTVTVSKAPVLVALTPDHTTPPLHSTVNLLATVENLYGYQAPLTGTVDFFDGSTKIGSGTLPSSASTSGSYNVTVAVEFTTAGVHALTAKYEGDANDLANTSGIADVTVSTKSGTSLTIIGPGFALATTPTEITADVAGDANGTAPTGTVTFTDASANSGQGATLGTATLLSGSSATLNVTTLAAGTHFIYASYAGDSNYAGSASQAMQILVGDFTVTAAPTSVSATAGQSTGAITVTFNGTAQLSQTGYATPNVSLACSGLPTGAACNFTSTAIALAFNTDGTSTGTAQVTISTEGPTLQAAARRTGGVFPVALAGLAAFGLPLVLRRRRFLASLLSLTLLLFVAGLNGCGGGGGGGYRITNPGTPGGSSNVSITATMTVSGNAPLSHSATVTLNVTGAGQ
ncbi:MAG TPA: Ig-like domain repeat protein [Terracidiphilus sp.]|nr:Ig-like domain repeat protein [Terracidiphilus sp.]